MMKSIENRGITATDTLKNEVAGKTKSLFGQAKTSQTAGALCAIKTEILLKNENAAIHGGAKKGY
jgi:hypothetical protein